RAASGCCGGLRPRQRQGRTRATFKGWSRRQGEAEGLERIGSVLQVAPEPRLTKRCSRRRPRAWVFGVPCLPARPPLLSVAARQQRRDCDRPKAEGSCVVVVGRVVIVGAGTARAALAC